MLSKIWNEHRERIGSSNSSEPSPNHFLGTMINALGFIVAAVRLNVLFEHTSILAQRMIRCATSESVLSRNIACLK